MSPKLYMLCILTAMLCITSCKNNYYIENDLHGIWQVTSIEKKMTNEIIEPQGTLYYLFQRSMVSLCYNYLDIPEKLTNYIAHFDLIGADSIGMGDFRFSTSGEGDKNEKEKEVPLDNLKKFGIYQDYTVFHMQQSRQKMIFTSDSVYVVLRKY